MKIRKPAAPPHTRLDRNANRQGALFKEQSTPQCDPQSVQQPLPLHGTGREKDGPAYDQDQSPPVHRGRKTPGKQKQRDETDSRHA